MTASMGLGLGEYVLAVLCSVAAATSRLGGGFGCYQPEPWCFKQGPPVWPHQKLLLLLLRQMRTLILPGPRGVMALAHAL